MVSISRHRGVALLIASAILPLTVTWAAAAGDVAAGRRKALQCQTCHGLDGLSKLPEAPHLAGQPERYLVKSLDDYRQGLRKDEMMTLVVKDLTDQDVADLAAYYAAIEISAKAPN
jgi:cytochrome c553